MLILLFKVTCIDPRVHPEAILGLQGFEAVIYRTIARHPQPALDDLAILDIEGGDSHFEDIMVIYHTDCGSLGFDVPKIRSKWAERAGSAATSQMEERKYGCVEK